MFHLSMWRERLRNSLGDVSEGRPMTPQPPIEQLDELNDAELSSGIGTPLADAAARSDLLLGEIIDLYTKVGERPFQWGRARTTTEAVLGNSYTHPRSHMYAYFNENGETDRANEIYEDAVSELRAASAPDIPMGAVLYNLACVRARQGRKDEALDLVDEALKLRPDLKAQTPTDEDLATLRDDPRFQELVKG